MATPATFTAADALIKGADKAAENTTKSAYDGTFTNFQLPTDPSKLGAQYGQAAKSLSDSLDITSALDRSNKLTQDSAVADAASMFENRTKSDELSKTPVADLDGEIQRLSEQRWGILPAVLGRSDIIDYGAKMRIASQAQGILDEQITKLTNTRKSIADAADSRAKDKIDELKATAALLDKQQLAAKNDLSSRIDMFKAGTGTYDDIVKSALELQKINDARKSAASDGNSLIGAGGVGTYSPAELSAFAWADKFGDFPVTDSSKLQLKLQLATRYRSWIAEGRPGSKIVTGAGQPLPTGMAGPTQPVTTDIDNLFATPAAVNQTNAQLMIKNLFAPK